MNFAYLVMLAVISLRMIITFITIKARRNYSKFEWAVPFNPTFNKAKNYLTSKEKRVMWFVLFVWAIQLEWMAMDFIYAVVLFVLNPTWDYNISNPLFIYLER